MDYVEQLTDAGLDVVVGTPQWAERGTPIADAGEVEVVMQGGPEDDAAAIDAAVAAEVHAYVRRDGSVWVLGGATVGDAPTVRVMVAAAEDGKGKPTRKQQDALDVVMSVLDGVAAGATLPDEPIHAERNEVDPED